MKEDLKLLPQALDAESSVIGTCLSYGDSIHEIFSILKPEMFYSEANKKIYQAMIEIAGKNGSVDTISLTDHLRKNNSLEAVGGVVKLMKFTDSIVTNHNLINHAMIVREKYTLREYILAGIKLSNMAYSEDLSDVVNYAETALFNISNFTQSKEPRSISHAIDSLLIDVYKIYTQEKKLVGVPSGYSVIDRITGGWQGGNLIILAGRPGMGKTALALNMVRNSAALGHPVALFSLEMSETELATRYLSGVSGYTNTEIRSAKLNYDKLVSDSNTIADLPIYTDDTPSINLFELRSKIKKLIIRHHVEAVFVDYLQLMHGEGSSREQEISFISRGLKSIAKEHDIPIIALSQLNRDVESRGNRQPRLSDLRESGAIEQDADIVCLIYRPAYYKLDTVTIDRDNYDAKGLIVFDIAKNRNGALFTYPLYHNESVTDIYERST